MKTITIRTAREIFCKTNELARELYRIRGYSAAPDFDFSTAAHPHEQQAWAGACAAQYILTATDMDDVIAELEDED